MFLMAEKKAIKMNPNIVAILPTYNQEKNITGLIEEVKKYVSKIIVVSDGSTDRTAEIAGESGAIVPEPIMKRGKGSAIIKGVEFSKKLSPDVIIFMDSDGEHEPKYIPQFLRLLEDNDFVVGQRVFYRSGHRKLVNKFNNFWMSLIIPNITDVQCGFRAIKADLLRKMSLTSTNFQIEQEMLLEAAKSHIRIKGVSIQSEPRGETNLNVLDYLQINNFFDRWVIKNHKYLDILFFKKIMLLCSASVGLPLGIFLEKILRLVYSFRVNKK